MFYQVKPVTEEKYSTNWWILKYFYGRLEKLERKCPYALNAYKFSYLMLYH